jgi:hypothetical protein
LEKLKFDPELYVRKSVSNHLNDIAKDHPDQVIQILKVWKTSAPPQHATEINWIVQRSLRSLIKAGSPKALRLIGVSRNAKIRFANFKLKQKALRLGERIEFEFDLHSLSAKPQKLVIDYILHFVKANQKTSPKVFKLKTLVLQANQQITLTKRHHLKKVTTRTHYAGNHYIEIQVNGICFPRMGWTLLI